MEGFSEGRVGGGGGGGDGCWEGNGAVDGEGDRKEFK